MSPRLAHRLQAALALGAVALTAACATTPSAAASVMLYGEPTPASYWSVNHTAIMNLFDNGQCTEWAALKRPDVVRRGVEAVVSGEIARHQPQDMGDWDARYWPALATAAGFATGHTPRAHALMVFQPGVLGASWPSGHIAYVEQVYGNGSFLISQMHAPLLGQVSYWTLPAVDARISGITFIY